ncbi:hypothetical protein GDO86_011538 [Hymenochirus boettgeri]|uniref:Anillin n=1 Tax=Hymenochirus boettgeri TaxID=247094 RepID=A0A8T2JGS3_9PIPI|nr:hypothetical protein GDO86_011538 [Hymenochirus boettgeri]
MDPFTEKLLERTRARRENLQKKMADRPTAGARTAVLNKRPREPLLEANNQPPNPTEETKPCSKPSPSKRRCSDHTETPGLGSENKQPESPDMPRNLQSTISSHEQVIATVQSHHATSCSPSDKREECLNSDTSVASSMKTRMQKLADQRRCWDSNGRQSCSPPAPISNREPIVSPPKPELSAISDTPVGRRGRFANLAATIGSWEDDLNHPCVKPNNTQEKPGTACLSKVSAASSASVGINSSSVKQDIVPCSQRPKDSSHKNKVVSICSLETVATAANTSSVVGSTKITEESNSLAVTSPSKKDFRGNENDLPSSKSVKYNSHNQSPQKVERPTSRIFASQTAAAIDDLTKVTPVLVQPKDKTATPGIKSFLERFGEKCQERSPAPVNLGQKSAVLTPNTKSIQERLLKQNELSSTACLAQQQKKEREKELASLRGRYDKGSVWTKKQDVRRETQTHPTTSVKPPKPDVASFPAKEKAQVSNITDVSQPNMAERVASPKKNPESLESQSSLKVSGPDYKPILEDSAEVVREIEMSVDGDLEVMNSSGVINSIFSNVLEEDNSEEVAQSLPLQVDTITDHEESGEENDFEAEEDALNITSMSLLTPLAETVGVGSPEALLSPSKLVAGMSESCESPKSGKFQMTCGSNADSEDGFSSSEENQNLLYSIDAYRSQRFKDTDRPPVVQTIVRKEDVSLKMDDKKNNGSPRPVNIKQKMKVLNNEINLQQTVIHQASQALNCCIDEEHGKGSQTEAEAERLLLVATEKRAALIVELNRVKNEGPQSYRKHATAESSPSRGRISIAEMFLPLKADFICNTSQKTDAANYYFFLMIRAGAENMVATPLASISSAMKGDALAFPTTFTLEDVSSDFEINVDVYSLVQKKEGLGPDKKKKP